MTDGTIIADILGGETARFSKLVERYLPLVRGICASHVRDPSAQDDLVQESFLTGYLRLDRLRNPERFGPWLARIARHECLTWVRSQARSEKAHRQMARATSGAPAPDPLDEAARREMEAWARREIAALPKSTREAMVLCYIEGFAVREAARVLGVRESAIKKRLEYGRRIVGEKMLRGLGERPSAADTENLTRRVVLALPLGAAPWKISTAESVTTVAATGGALATAKVAALLLLPVVGAGVAIQQLTSRPEEETTAAAAVAGGGVGEAVYVGARPERAKRSAIPKSAELAVVFRYRVGQGAVAPGVAGSEGSGGGPVSLPPSEWPPVVKTPVRLQPLRPHKQVQEMLFGDSGLGADFAMDLWARARRYGGADWWRRFERQELGAEALVGQKETLLELRAKYGENVLKQLLDQLVSPGPAGEWITRETSDEGTVVFSDVAPGHYRVELVLSDAGVPSTPPSRSPSQGGTTGRGAATVERDAVEAAARRQATVRTDVYLQEGKRHESTIHVTDTVSEIKGTVVDAETGEPVGLGSLFASGEALSGAEHRMWVGSDGSFRIDPSITGFGTFVIEAKPDGFVPVTVHGIREPGVPVNVTVALSRRPTISGHVLDPCGAPVAGVPIMRRDVDGAGWRSVARTDETGFYSASHDGGVITLYASGTMSQTDEHTFQLEADESVVHDFAMPATANAILHIRTEADEVPAAIDMAALRTENHSLAGTVLKREGDHYVVPYLKPARYHLVFAVHGYETVSRTFTIGDDLADEEMHVKLVRSEHTLTVQVVDTDGSWRSGVDVNLMLVVKKVDDDGLVTGSSSSSIAREMTDEEGLAIFRHLAPEVYRIHCEGESKAVTLPREDTVVLTLGPREVEPDVLYLDLENARAYDLLKDNLPLELDEDAVYVLAPSGRLSNRNMEVGENVVFGFKSGYPPASTVIDVSADLVAKKEAVHSNVYDEPFELVFAEAGAVRGVVESATGKRVAKEELRVFPVELWEEAQAQLNRHPWRSFGRAFAGGDRSGDDGVFRVRSLPPGTYVVCASNGSVSEPFEIVAGRETGPLLLRR